MPERWRRLDIRPRISVEAHTPLRALHRPVHRHREIERRRTTGIETAIVDPKFNPTSDNGTGIAFATLETQFRNTETGKAGIFCAVCHSMATTRETPFHNYEKSCDNFVEAFTGVPVTFVSVGPGREQTVVLPRAA